jgi:hypothetical protein
MGHVHSIFTGFLRAQFSLARDMGAPTAGKEKMP